MPSLSRPLAYGALCVGLGCHTWHSSDLLQLGLVSPSLPELSQTTLRFLWEDLVSSCNEMIPARGCDRDSDTAGVASTIVHIVDDAQHFLEALRSLSRIRGSLPAPKRAMIRSRRMAYLSIPFLSERTIFKTISYSRLWSMRHSLEFLVHFLIMVEEPLVQLNAQPRIKRACRRTDTVHR